MNDLAARLISLIQSFGAVPGAIVRESPDVLRIEETECTSDDNLRELSAISIAFDAEKLGRITFWGTISGEIDSAHASCGDYEGEKCRLLIEKTYTQHWCYFLTLDGWERAIQDHGFVASTRAIWVAADFEEFSSHTLHVTPWGGPKEYRPAAAGELERPRRLVRDQTYENAPPEITPWLLTSAASPSPVYTLWQRAAISPLSFALPFEIREIEEILHVVLKGPRSTPIPVATVPSSDSGFFGSLTEAAQWVYSPAREAEVKFTFLNYHLSLDWPQGEPWPTALPRVLSASLASARDAFTYHLHAQATESLKSMADLRRSLQDEVSKVQQATRDLLTALWRDFAVAGVVLALRSPSAKDVISTEALRLVTVGAAVLLALSLLITIASTARFNWLAAQGRREWRKRSYAFIPDTDWLNLVEKPLKSGRRVFWVVIIIISLFYGVTIAYLLSVGLSRPPATQDRVTRDSVSAFVMDIHSVAG